MEAWVVEFTGRDKGGYAYETENFNIVFANEKEADQFFADLPKWFEKNWGSHYELENRYPAKKLGSAICHYNHETMEVEPIKGDIK